jgi:signal transduction histidine kinase/DNA-binding NarL/FixJ family response regulator
LHSGAGEDQVRFGSRKRKISYNEKIMSSKQISKTHIDCPLWLWRSIWVLSLLSFLGVSSIYLWLPLDGAAGDSGSFTSDGFLVKWLIEERPGGLRVGDVITHMDGRTIEEWLRGEPEWGASEIITYEVLREGQPLTLQIQLAPISFHSILARWIPETLVVLCFFIIGSVIFWMRPHEPAVRWQMLFTVLIAMQYWIDGYNYQPGTLPWAWPFWFHFALENISWFLAYASLLMFVLVFPQTNIIMRRFPRLVPWIVLSAGIIVQIAAYLTASTMATAIKLGSRVSFFPVMVQLVLATGVAIHSGITNRDPVARAQLKWILAGCSVPLVVAIAGYSLPTALFGRPLVSREVSMFSSVLVPLSFAAAVLRYRIFDIELIINRGLVYGILTALLGGLYLLLVRLLTSVAQALVQTGNENLIVFIATLTIALAFAPLRERVQALIDRAFFRSKVNYQRLLPELSEQLSTNIVLGRLNQLLTEEIPHRLQIVNAMLLVLDSAGRELVFPNGDLTENQSQKDFSLTLDHPLVDYLRRTNQPLLRSRFEQVPEPANNFLDEHKIELSIALIVGKADGDTGPIVGLYNLGPKLSGIPYANDEVQLLTVLGKQAAVSVENARLYREIESYSRTLEQQVEQRTQQLVEAKEIAEIANRAKSTFLATMSHELRTPLNGILGYAQIIQRAAVTPSQQRKGVEVIEQSGKHLLALINDVLDLAKVESGTVELYAVDIQLPAFLKGIGEIARVRAERKGIKFHLELSDRLPQHVHADERRLRQVLLNLLGNAVKFTDVGQVILRVKVGSQELVERTHILIPDSRFLVTVTFEVTDTGIGISPEELESIFDPFIQAGDQDRQDEGTGLGLAISYNLVSLMGSELYVESQLGKGSRFWFEIEMPVVDAKVGDEDVVTDTHLGQQIMRVRESQPKILVVDDRWENRAVFRDLLESLGFEIYEAEHGRDGLAQLSEFQPDSIIVDLVMPGMGGFEFIRQVRAMSQYAETPIIATSASVYEADQQHSARVGGDAFLPKPVDADLLLEQLGRLLNLEWQYNQEPGFLDAEFILPSTTTLGALLDLSISGDIETLREELIALARADEKFKPFVNQFQQLAQGYKLKRIRELLREYLV